MSVLPVTGVPRPCKPAEEVSSGVESRVDIHWKRLIKVVWEIEVHKIQQETGYCCDSPSPQRRTLWSRPRIRYLAILPAVLLPGTLFLRLRLRARVGTTVEGWYSAALGVGVQAAVWRGVVGLKLRGPLDFLQCPHWKIKRQDDTFFHFCYNSQIRLFLQHTNHHDQITNSQ